MSNLEERAAKVLRKHREELNEENVCICGHHGDWPAHAARVVLEELALTQEWGMQVTGEDLNSGQPLVIDCDDEEHARRSTANMDKSRDHAEVVTRLASSWVGVTDQ